MTLKQLVNLVKRIICQMLADHVTEWLVLYFQFARGIVITTCSPSHSAVQCRALGWAAGTIGREWSSRSRQPRRQRWSTLETDAHTLPLPCGTVLGEDCLVWAQVAGQGGFLEVARDGMFMPPPTKFTTLNSNPLYYGIGR